MKSSSKSKRPLRIITISLGIILAVIIIFWFFDIVLNGMIVDWFENNYMTTYEEYIPDVGKVGIIHRPNWDMLKQLLFVVVIAILFIGMLVVILVSHLYAKSRVRKNTKEIGKMLHDYILSEKDAADIFPENYRDIATQMSEIKAQMRSHEQILKEETARKNDLILYLAHDLKTPLASVIGYLNLLRDERHISEDLQERYLSISLEKAERLEDLINEFFDIARFNLTDISLQYSKINLTRLLEQLAYEFKPMLKEKNLTCNLQIPDDLMLRCDANKIQRAFDNLLRNAVIYSYPDTEVNVTVVRQNDDVVIKFINHGDTISKENLERIFEQFYRLDISRSTSSGGAGLGLAISKRIIELHHGTITASSENDLIEFTVTLPTS